MSEEKKDFYCIYLNDTSYGYHDLDSALDVLAEHIKGMCVEHGDEAEILITTKKMTQAEYDALPEVEL